VPAPKRPAAPLSPPPRPPPPKEAGGAPKSELAEGGAADQARALVVVLREAREHVAAARAEVLVRGVGLEHRH
jgi:hypothetical protein